MSSTASRGWPHGGHVTLARGERSRLAAHASEILWKEPKALDIPAAVGARNAQVFLHTLHLLCSDGGRLPSLAAILSALFRVFAWSSANSVRQ